LPLPDFQIVVIRTDRTNLPAHKTRVSSDNRQRRHDRTDFGNSAIPSESLVTIPGGPVPELQKGPTIGPFQ
jgi:hypothetical protein